MAGSERRKARGVASRTFAAVGLWLGFYGLGVGVSGALLFLPFAQARYEGSVGFAGVFSGLGALAVLWALFPRIEPDQKKNEPRSAPHPELVKLVGDVARRIGQRPPDVVVVLPDANAFAARRPRWFGLRSRSIVGVGLGLFVVLDRDELTSVIAHEMGHHHGGDLRLGPWIFRTRRAIGHALDRLEGSSFWLHLPFVAYGELFLRITRRASREQELAADALAAQVSGAATTASALERVHALGALWDVYWDQEVLPLLERGARPPIVEGFTRLQAETSLRPELVEEVARTAKRAPSPVDTHPPLAERLAQLGAAPASREATAPATTLLGDLEVAEASLVAAMLVDPSKMPPRIEWDDIGEAVFVARFHATKQSHASLAGACPSSIPDMLRDGEEWSARLRDGLAIFSPEAERRRLRAVLGEWLAAELHGAGFSARKRPGADLELVRGDEVVRPLAVVRDLASGALEAAVWRARWADLTRPAEVGA